MKPLLPPALRFRRKRPVLVLVDLVQDIDALLPVLMALRDDRDLEPRVWVSRWLAQESPRTARLLDLHRLPFAYVRRRDVIEGARPSLRGIAAVLSAAESSHPAHTAAHALARRADAAGLPTYALQHGFENLGLFGVEAAAAVFASRTVFCWFPPALTPADLPGETRAKLDHVGRPSPVFTTPVAAPPQFDLGVFENLHWDRYGDDERTRFREGLLAAARSLPDLKILLRPHPAGGWGDELSRELAQFPNVTAPAASEVRLEGASGSEVLQDVRRVITTPSTVALDAALAGRPTALAADGGEIYAPLPVLRTPADWIAFARGDHPDLARLDRFRSRVLVAGDGAPRILARLLQDLQSRTRASHGD